MRERGIGFIEAVNLAIRASIAHAPAPSQSTTPTFDLGAAQVPLEKAIYIAGKLEDEELLRKVARKK